MRDSASRQRAGILTMHFAAGAPQRPRPRNGLRCWHGSRRQGTGSPEPGQTGARGEGGGHRGGARCSRKSIGSRGNPLGEVEKQAGARSTSSARLGARPGRGAVAGRSTGAPGRLRFDPGGEYVRYGIPPPLRAGAEMSATFRRGPFRAWSSSTPCTTPSDAIGGIRASRSAMPWRLRRPTFSAMSFFGPSRLRSM
jgi:hypothetical protein